MISKHDLVREQQILAEKGFYAGEIDGVWGPGTIQAKKEFERSESFVPGVPNSGLPMRENPPYPPGITRGKDGLLQMEGASFSEVKREGDVHSKPKAPLLSPEKKMENHHLDIAGLKMNVESLGASNALKATTTTTTTVPPKQESTTTTTTTVPPKNQQPKVAPTTTTTTTVPPKTQQNTGKK